MGTGAYGQRRVRQAPGVPPAQSSSFTLGVWSDTVMARIGAELTLYLDSLGQPGAFPARLLGQTLGGAFTAPTLMNALAAFHERTGQATLGRHDLLTWVHAYLPLARETNTFGQVYTLRALASFGDKLSTNPFWARLDVRDREAYRRLADSRQVYDPATGLPRQGRPINYLGVALLVEAEAVALGLSESQPSFARLDSLYELCLSAAERTQLWLDDDPRRSGRHDRYGLELARFVWQAQQRAPRPAYRARALALAQWGHDLWADALSEGRWVSMTYGRSLQVSWDDAFEQAFTVAAWPELAGGPRSSAYVGMLKSGLTGGQGTQGWGKTTHRQGANPPLGAVSAYWLGVARQAWGAYLRDGFDTRTHLNRMVEPGRGTYSYAGPERTFGYTVGTWAKVIESLGVVRQRLAADLPLDPAPRLPDVDRYVSSSLGVTVGQNAVGGASATRPSSSGLWVYRRQGQAWLVPIVASSSNQSVSDYQPGVFGVSGVEVPVGLSLPFLSPYIYQTGGQAYTVRGPAQRITHRPAPDDTSASTLVIEYPHLSAVKGTETLPAVAVEQQVSLAPGRIRVRFVLKSFSTLPYQNLQLAVPVSYPVYEPGSGTFLEPGGQAIRVTFTGPEGSLLLPSTNRSPAGLGPFGPVYHTVYLNVPAGILPEGQATEVGYDLIIGRAD